MGSATASGVATEARLGKTWVREVAQLLEEASEASSGAALAQAAGQRLEVASGAESGLRWEAAWGSDSEPVLG